MGTGDPLGPGSSELFLSLHWNSVCELGRVMSMPSFQQPRHGGSAQTPMMSISREKGGAQQGTLTGPQLGFLLPWTAPEWAAPSSPSPHMQMKRSL